VAGLLFFAYMHFMLWRNSRGKRLNAPAAFIHPCQPTVAKEPPSGPGWAHELKHDGYRLQIHVRDGRVRLYTSTSTAALYVSDCLSSLKAINLQYRFMMTRPIAIALAATIDEELANAVRSN
jgi:hypothetical protein